MPSHENATPNEVVAQNVGYLLKRRGLSRRELTHRMNALGLNAWQHDKTIRRVLDGEKRITTDELVALALALETTVETLLTPGVKSYAEESKGDLRAYEGKVMMGDLSIGSMFFLSVVSRRSPHDRPSPGSVIDRQSSRLVWDEWDRDLNEGAPPRWQWADSRADMLDAARTAIRALYPLVGLDVPDDLDDADGETLDEYFHNLTSNRE